jgi:GNAT superfamily N-acetyltransferase
MALEYGAASDFGLEPEQIGAFYDAHWRRKVALSSAEFYRWQFKQAPAAAGEDHCLVAFDTSARAMAGIMGLTPRPFHLAGRTVLGGELTTWVVDPRFRGEGVGYKILAELQRRYDVLASTGASTAAIPVFLRAGFKYLRHTPRFVRVHDFQAIARIAKVTPLAEKLWEAWRDQEQVAFSVSGGIDGAEDIIQAARRDFNFFARDAAHLNWRYRDHPTFRYQTYIVRGAAGACLVALRDELSVEGLRLVHVTDMIGDADGIRAAVAFVDDYCRQQGMHAADFFCTTPKITRFLVAYGWFSIQDHEFFEFPHLFHPVELRTPPTSAVMYTCKSDPEAMCDLSRLYVTKSDVDSDRPVPGP